MSEALPGMQKPPVQPARVRDAAAVVLYRRRGAGGAAVFWLKRGKDLRFAGGFYAFPGGRVDPADSEVPVEGAEGLDAALVVAAARELLEETGVLVADGADRVSARQRADMRRALLEAKATFATLLKEHGLRLRKRDFVDAGRWITPPFMPVRFDARFFLVEAPAAQDAEVWPGELSEGRWIKPAEALELWNEGRALLHPPNLHAMRVMATFTTPEDAAQRLSTPQNAPGHIPSRIEFQRGIHLFPLETDTLPPATHTNAYVVGNGELLIVDPGSKEVRQYARLLALIAGMVAEGKRPRAIFLTHHHADHVGGALAVKERLKIPIWAHERTAERLPAGAVDRLLVDDEVIDLQGLPAMKLRVLHTPGHARGHLCLIDEATRAAIVGDMVAGVGTIVIDPPEGDMTDYLAQLERLKNLPVSTLYPAHGPVIPDGPGKLEEYLLHRQHRERLVFEAIPRFGATLHEVVKKAYADTMEAMHPIAERSAQAILIKLVREGRVVRRDERYFHA
ncbi:MAG: MBL fold metallo-hydrolase [Myxococcaceae bacterium]|nr:MBL fold metallo-hydrolase [Myxococcaceae bacterium]